MIGQSFSHWGIVTAPDGFQANVYFLQDGEVHRFDDDLMTVVRQPGFEADVLPGEAMPPLRWSAEPCR